MFWGYSHKHTTLLLDKLGGSILVYEVKSRGPVRRLILGNGTRSALRIHQGILVSVRSKICKEHVSNSSNAASFVVVALKGIKGAEYLQEKLTFTTSNNVDMLRYLSWTHQGINSCGTRASSTRETPETGDQVDIHSQRRRKRGIEPVTGPHFRIARSNGLSTRLLFEFRERLKVYISIVICFDALGINSSCCPG